MLTNRITWFGIAIISMSVILFAQDFSGTFQMQSGTGHLTLQLESEGYGEYYGTLTGNGNNYEVDGFVDSGYLTGSVGDELDGIVFQAVLNGSSLSVTLSEVDMYGNIIPGSAQNLNFSRASTQHSTHNPNQNAQPDQGSVVINGQTLNATQIQDLEQTYGIKPQPGNYWYDARSGLYGVVGYAAFGYMQPGHQFGSVARSASNGNTGVVINGREIPMNEYTVWSYMVGTWITPGNYWLDHNGNAGYEGSPIPVINLYVAAQQNAYRGQGGGGDNFWSSRFSAGNSDRGGSRGYVSVPGYGPVGYGFD